MKTKKIHVITVACSGVVADVFAFTDEKKADKHYNKLCKQYNFEPENASECDDIIQHYICDDGVSSGTN